MYVMLTLKYFIQFDIKSFINLMLTTNMLKVDYSRFGIFNNCNMTYGWIWMPSFQLSAVTDEQSANKKRKHEE